MGAVNVGVIGLGMGRNHATDYLKCPQANLLAICDKDEAWLKYCQKEWGVPHASTDADEMLALPELQAVSVTTPTFLHKSQTLAALKRGLHVLCEKPMAMNQAEGEEMVAAAKAAGKFLMIGYNQRFGDNNRTLKKLIDEGLLGDIYFMRTIWQRRMFMPTPIAWRPTGSYDRTWALEKDKSGGGALLDLGVHMLDLAWWLAGRPEFRDSVSAMYAKFGPQMAAKEGAHWDIEDLAVGFLRFQNGLSVELETSFASHIDAERVYIEIYGSEGGISTRSGKIMLYHNVAGIHTDSEITKRVAPETTQAHFIKSILSGTPPDPSGEDGVEGLRMLDALYESAGEPLR